MKNMKSAPLRRALGTKLRLRSQAAGPALIFLFSLFAVTSLSFFFEGNSRVKAEQNRQHEFAPPVMNLPRMGPFLLPTKPRPHEDHIWREEIPNGIPTLDLGIGARPKLSRSVRLNEAAQRSILRQTPMEFTKAANQRQVIMTLPMPDGTLSRFRVEESPVMAPKLAALFPNIKTYRGRGVDDPTTTTRFDVTPAGFHAIVLSSQGTTIIEPDPHGRRGKYLSYDQRDGSRQEGSFSCIVHGVEQASAQLESKQLARRNYSSVTSATTLSTYRLALAATAEFTEVYGGGTVAGALSAMTTTINAVNAIYERDLAIHLTLVANQTSIIFTNPATDGYTSDNVNLMLTENQVVLDQRIGRANYDLGMVLDGHVFNFEPGRFIFQGAANFQSTCKDSQKGRAATVFRSTDPTSNVAIYVVAHELAHLLGALHTFNGTLDDCGPSRFAQVAYEPGGGSTIMGYRGGVLPNGTYFPICASDDLNSTDNYFHTVSIDQIVNYTTQANGSFCPTVTETGNNSPNVNAGASYTIPANTPFTLTAAANDPEGDALTYCWEQFDLGAAGPPHTDNGDRPIFRSFAPTPIASRTFPQLSDVLSGNSTFGESLPTTSRTMNFRVTVRDNHPGGGGVNTAATQVSVIAGSGPFAVTNPQASTTWTAGSNQTVTWDVAATSSGPINCTNIRILLSVDGGISFPFTLAANVPNSGTATISVPNTPTSSARIKVEAIGNIFFSISRPNFTISPNNTLAPALMTEPNTNRAIALDSVSYTGGPFALSTAHNFSFDQRTRVMLFATGLELLPGEDISVVTAQAEDAAHNVFPLVVEYVGKVPNFDWLTQVNIRLPTGLGPGDVLVTISLRGVTSTKVIMGIR